MIQRGQDSNVNPGMILGDAIRQLLLEVRPTLPVSEEDVDSYLSRFLSRPDAPTLA